MFLVLTYSYLNQSDSDKPKNKPRIVSPDHIKLRKGFLDSPVHGPAEKTLNNIAAMVCYKIMSLSQLKF